MTLLAALTWGQWAVTLILIAVCALLMLIILVQQASGGGLVGAFGGGGGSSAFGAKTGDVFTVITVVLASIYLLLAITGNYLFEPAGAAPAAAVAGQPVVPLDDADATLPTDEGPSAPATTPPGATEPPAGQMPTDEGPAASQPATGGDSAPGAAGGTPETGPDDSQTP